MEAAVYQNESVRGHRFPSMAISAPTDVTIGQTADVEVSWIGLDAGTKYLGAVSHGTPSGLAGLTVVSVATD
jgi:hypothetical protein